MRTNVPEKTKKVFLKNNCACANENKDLSLHKKLKYNSMNIEEINQEAEKYKLSVERDAFIKGVRTGFQLASNKYIELLSKQERLRTNNVIVVEKPTKEVEIKFIEV